jgi:hypothetical protein
VRQIDEIHDAENEREARRQKKKQQAELQAVKDLFDQEKHNLSSRMGHRPRKRAIQRPWPA